MKILQLNVNLKIAKSTEGPVMPLNTRQWWVYSPSCTSPISTKAEAI